MITEKLVWSANGFNFYETEMTKQVENYSYKVFVADNGNERVYVLFDKNGNPIYANTSICSVSDKIEMLRLASSLI